MVYSGHSISDVLPIALASKVHMSAAFWLSCNGRLSDVLADELGRWEHGKQYQMGQFELEIYFFGGGWRELSILVVLRVSRQIARLALSHTFQGGQRGLSVLLL